MMMMWFDDGKKPVVQKIAEAIAAYVRHFMEEPNLVLVHQEDAGATGPEGVMVRTAAAGEVVVHRHQYFVGLA